VLLAALDRYPAWADAPGLGLRSDAARAAIGCADGQGENAPPPAERPAYRKQALDLLTSELAALQKHAAADRDIVNRKTREWYWDKELASVRDPTGLKRLPPGERDAWEKLWADVRDLAARTAPPKE
jgi:hypothetical protein